MSGKEKVRSQSSTTIEPSLSTAIKYQVVAFRIVSLMLKLPNVLLNGDYIRLRR